MYEILKSREKQCEKLNKGFKNKFKKTIEYCSQTFNNNLLFY